MRKILFVLTFLTLTNFISAQNELSFEFDYAKFHYDSTAVYLEFYYELNPLHIQITKTDKGNLIEAIVHIELKNTETGNFVLNKDWKIQNILIDSVENTLKGTFGLAVQGGKYSLLVNAVDSKNPNLKKTINENLIIIPFKSGKFSMSDIELAANIKKENADQQSLFYKNTLEVIPNPSMVYTHQSPVLFFYTELYNLKLAKPTADFSLQKLLYNSAGIAVYKNSKNIKQGGSSVVEMGLINLKKYPSDTYKLVFSLIDQSTNQAFISSKQFYLYNPNVVDSLSGKAFNSSVASSEFGIYTVEECDKLFTQSKYIATDNEIKQYKALDSLSAKRQFLFNFWKNRDSNPATPLNEFKDDYMKRIAYANQNFSTANREGFLSDRGRVVLIYGEPDQRDFFPSDSNMKPYEVWFYSSLEGGANFIFGDITGFGNYQLLHSTKRGEVNDENWKHRLTIY